MKRIIESKEYATLFNNLKQYIPSNCTNLNPSELTSLYHYIGMKILIAQKEHGWDSKIINYLSVDLKSAFPQMICFETQQLKDMRNWAETQFRLDSSSI